MKEDYFFLKWHLKEEKYVRLWKEMWIYKGFYGIVMSFPKLSLILHKARRELNLLVKTYLPSLLTITSDQIITLVRLIYVKVSLIVKVSNYKLYKTLSPQSF